MSEGNSLFLRLAEWQQKDNGAIDQRSAKGQRGAINQRSAKDQRERKNNDADPT